MITEYNAARLMVHKAATSLEKKENSTFDSAMAKRYATDVCFKICNEALQIHGGYGICRILELKKWLEIAEFIKSLKEQMK